MKWFILVFLACVLAGTARAPLRDTTDEEIARDALYAWSRTSDRLDLDERTERQARHIAGAMFLTYHCAHDVATSLTLNDFPFRGSNLDLEVAIYAMVGVLEQHSYGGADKSYCRFATKQYEETLE